MVENRRHYMKMATGTVDAQDTRSSQHTEMTFIRRVRCDELAFASPVRSRRS